MDRTLEQTARLGELKLQNHDPKITAKKKKHNKDNAEQQQHSFKRNLGQTDFGDHWEQKKKENKLEETTQLGDSTKRNPPQKDPEISAEKKNKDGDRDSIYDDNAEQQQQQQQQHSLLRKLGEAELRDHSEQQQQKKKNESSEEEEVSDYLYQSSEEEVSDSLIYKSSEEEEENMSDASEYDELDYESCEAFGHLVKEITAEQEKLDNEKRLACEAKGETYISDVKRRRLAYENSAEAEERYGQMICASEGFHVCDEATEGTCLVGHTHYVKIDDYLIDAAKFAVKQCNKKVSGEGKKRLKFERLLRATRQDQLYRLTLECTDGQFYEAKVWWSVAGRKKSKLYFLRRAKYYPAILCCT